MWVVFPVESCPYLLLHGPGEQDLLLVYEIGAGEEAVVKYVCVWGVVDSADVVVPLEDLPEFS